MLEIGGTTEGSDYDVRSTLGPLDFAGTVAVILVISFEPAVAGTFTVPGAGTSLVDNGFSLSLPALSGGMDRESRATHSPVTLAHPNREPP